MAPTKEQLEEILRFFARKSFSLAMRSTDNNDEIMLEARKAAEHGLKLIESSGFQVDEDIKADLILAMGSTYSRSTSPADIRMVTALEYYMKALELKKKVSKIEDVDQI